MPTLLMIGAIAAAAANVLLAAVLFVLYRAVYAQTKAPFSLALLLFSVAFLAQNLLSVYSFVTMMDLMPSGLDPYLVGIGVLEALGLGAMVWTATR